MALTINLSAVLTLVLCSLVKSEIHREILKGNYNEIYEKSVNSNYEYIIEFKNNTSSFPTRVTVISERANSTYPILIVAQQQKDIISWQIPLNENHDIVLGTDYRTASHTLCPEILNTFRNESTRAINNRFFNSHECSNPTVVIKTLAPYNLRFKLKVTVEKNFFLRANKEYEKSVSPSEPVYYYYNFHDPENMANNSDAVLVSASSDSRICMLFSIQNTTCPVLDLESNIKYNSDWQTMSKKAAMVVTKRHYPNGFFVVMVVKHNDDECKDPEPVNFILKRTKVVRLRISPTITLQEHNTTAYVTLVIFAILLLMAMIGGVIYFIRIHKKANEVAQSSETTIGILDGERKIRWLTLCTLSWSDTNRNASNYVWLVTIVILFYILPVLQVAVTYQGIVNDTGNDDLCYYNFLCALPHKFIIHITDFNHVLSNIGYVFLGIVFIILTHLKSIRECTKQQEGFGLMKPYGMFYALGIALIMEGIMSACYHICPKKSNFQFDTSFMYVMTVLMIVNVYESRKADMKQRSRDERGYVVFFTLAGVTAISVIGSYLGSKNYFWILITILHILTCMCLTWNVETVYIKSIFKRSKRKQMNYIDYIHGSLLVFINAANTALAIFGLLMKYSFATHVLTVLITNGVLYTMFYIIMKMLHKEKIMIQTPILIVLSLLCWVPALYFFLTTVTTWEETPAESRNRNQECLLVRYYDSHDVWHFLSAFALFFTCWILLTLDEGLDQIPRSDIVDFHSERFPKFSIQQVVTEQIRQERYKPTEPSEEETRNTEERGDDTIN